MKCSNIGTPFKPLYEPHLSADGSLEVTLVGKEDLQAFIQSHAESCDIQSIVAKAVHDPSLLNARKGSFGDFTDLPKTYAEMLQKVIDAQILFDRLPMEKRAVFGNDVYKFISEMDDPEWIFKSGLASKREEDVTKPEVSEDESKR